MATPAEMDPNEAEMALLLDDYHRTDHKSPWDMLAICGKIRDNRIKGDKGAGANYWRRQVCYWMKEVDRGIPG